MSKEMIVIGLGAWVILVTQLGIPGPWRTTLLIITGIVLMIIGFLLRTEVLNRPQGSSKHPRQTFTENAAPSVLNLEHEQKERINSLN